MTRGTHIEESIQSARAAPYSLSVDVDQSGGHSHCIRGRCRPMGVMLAGGLL